MEATKPLIDFSNTENAFAHKSNRELKKTAWLYSMMNKAWLVKLGAPLALFFVRIGFPPAIAVIKKTIFEQFVGGTTLLETQPAIDKLKAYKTQTVLDYGAERKKSETAFNKTMNTTIRAIEFAATNDSVTTVSSKITGLARFELLESIQAGEALTKETRKEYRNLLKRIDSICHVANEKNVSVFFDAEESWIQDTIDHLVNLMMRRYNKKRPVVYNTFQLYRKDRLKYLMDSFNRAQEQGYILGAKLVRGAYMDKERERAQENGYPSPIHETRSATDDSYNTALRFCIDNFPQMAVSNSTHNADSALLMAELIEKKDLPKNHPYLAFCQLYGMSDNLTFNLAEHGYNVGKYLVFGTVQDVIPYLVRRAQENTSVTGDMSREYKLVAEEIKRRSKA